MKITGTYLGGNSLKTEQDDLQTRRRGNSAYTLLSDPGRKTVTQICASGS
jgi:hypothetical protein